MEQGMGGRSEDGAGRGRRWWDDTAATALQKESDGGLRWRGVRPSSAGRGGDDETARIGYQARAEAECGGVRERGRCEVAAARPGNPSEGGVGGGEGDRESGKGELVGERGRDEEVAAGPSDPNEGQSSERLPPAPSDFERFLARLSVRAAAILQVPYPCGRHPIPGAPPPRP